MSDSNHRATVLRQRAAQLQEQATRESRADVARWALAQAEVFANAATALAPPEATTGAEDPIARPVLPVQRGLILTRNRTTLLVECSHCTFGNGKPKRTRGGEAHIAASSSTHGRKIRKVGV
jgi:hypothetical protein